MRTLALIISTLSILVAQAQFELGTSIQLTGDSAVDRQVEQVNYPSNAEQGVPAMDVRDQSLIYDEVVGGAVINLVLSPAPASYSNGMLVSFVLTTANDSAAQLNVNSIGSVALVKDGTYVLDSAELAIGLPYHAIYANGVFNILKNTSSACPYGFDIVSRDYCIELQPDTAAKFYTAAILCAKKNARLCTMGEWMRACKKLNLESTISNWEWVDSAANHSNNGKVMGLDPVNFSSPDCEYGRTYAPTLNANFRCCYSR